MEGLPMPARSPRTLAVPESALAGPPARRRWLDRAADTAGKRAGDTAVLAPVTPLRPALATPREQELLQMLQTLPVALVHFDADGSIALVNDRATQLLHAAGQRAALRSGWALLEALDARLARRTRAALRQPGMVADRQRVFLRPAGRRPMELSVSVQVQPGGGCVVTLEEACASALRPTVG
jgi:PAS domain-containing protein